MIVPALADSDDHERARRAVEAGEILPLADILQTVERSMAGRVIEVELDREGGRWLYDLEIVSPDGQLHELEIDAATGAIISTEREHD